MDSEAMWQVLINQYSEKQHAPLWMDASPYLAATMSGLGWTVRLL